jgi:hypothetical protein
VPKAHYYLTLLTAMGTLTCVPSEPAPKDDKSRDNDLAYRPSDLAFKRQRATPVPAKPVASSVARGLPFDASAPPRALAPIVKPYVEHFDAPKLGADWNATSNAWRIEDGRLCGRSVHNHPAWLMRRLPKNARITFSAESDSENGDLKVEVWGDGRSGATGLSYTNATSYLFLLGAWKNQLNVLARIDEHGRDRLEHRIKADSKDPREQRVLPGTKYQFQIERRDGKTVVWSVDGVEMHRLVDTEPLLGPGHEHLGFNDWEVHACFDDLSIIPLPD